MLERWRKRTYSSYKDQKNKRHRVRWVLLGFLGFYGTYTFLAAFAFSTYVLQNNAMQPNLRVGDRFICSSYTLYRMVSPWLNAVPPVHRGNVVVVDMSLKEKRNAVNTLLNSLVRFFTAQQVGIESQGGQRYIKRIIGLPGDEISMTKYVFRVKPQDGSHTLTEFELWEKPYDVIIPHQVPALWDDSIPFSGNIEPFVLGEGECFVVSDDRSNTNDSRTWGPIPVDYILGKALFRYWPVTRFSRP
ncbi:MAG: signal peptidase I [Spirochaetaceae bacterium]|jgi:signal peptidase I|nr:signal peptidase I [Spirochaetaceae bacterium]